MRKVVRRVYSYNRGWWDSFTSCLLGTLLGIAITFGISAHLEHQAQRQLERRIQIYTVKNVEQTVNQMEAMLAELKVSDSIYSAVMDYYPDRLQDIPVELMKALYTDLFSWNYISTSQGWMGDVFSHEVEVWRNMDPRSVALLTDITSLVEMLREIVGQVQVSKEKIRENVFQEKYVMDVFDTEGEAVKVFFSNPENTNAVLMMLMLGQSMDGLMVPCKKMLQEVKEKLNLTAEDMEMYYSDIDGEEYRVRETR